MNETQFTLEMPTLMKFLKRKRLDSLVKELEDGYTTLEDCKARTEEDWRDFFGLAGVDIYNHLHPPQGKINMHMMLNLKLS